MFEIEDVYSIAQWYRVTFLTKSELEDWHDRIAYHIVLWLEQQGYNPASRTAIEAVERFLADNMDAVLDTFGKFCRSNLG